MKTCLVVDSSDVVRKVARCIFETLNLDTREAETGQGGLDICATAMPDAVLLDSHLPPMATVEFLTTLRGRSNGDKPVVIYCTTENSPGDIARALSSGADDYIMKPFDREGLRAKLADKGLI